MVVTSVCGHNFIKKDDEEYCYKCGLCLKYDENGRFIMYEKTPLERIAANLNKQAQLYGAEEVPNAIPPQDGLQTGVIETTGDAVRIVKQMQKHIKDANKDTQPDPDKEVDEMFVVGNMRFSGLSNDKLTPDRLKAFIRSRTQSALKKQREELVELYNQRIEKYTNDQTLSDQTRVALIVEYEYLLGLIKKDNNK